MLSVCEAAVLCKLIIVGVVSNIRFIHTNISAHLCPLPYCRLLELVVITGCSSGLGRETGKYN